MPINRRAWSTSDANRFRARIFGLKPVSELRPVINETDFPKLAQSVARSVYKGRWQFHYLIPKDFDDFYCHGLLTPVSLLGEIKWAISILSLHTEHLNLHIQYLESLDKAVHSGSVVDSKSILERIQENNGVSWYYLESKIAILQHFEGLDAQRNFIKSLKQELGVDSLPFWIATAWSRRNEDESSLNRFIEHYQKICNLPKYDKQFSSYLSYKLFKSIPNETFLLSSILAKESSSSFIDLYETLLHILSALSLNRAWWSSNIKAFIQELTTFSILIKDDRLFAIVQSLTTESLPTITTIKESPEESSIFKLLINSFVHKEDNKDLVMNGSTKAIYSIIEKLTCCILDRGEKFNDARTALVKMSLNYSSIPIGSQLLCLAYALDGIDPEIRMINYHNPFCLSSDILSNYIDFTPVQKLTGQINFDLNKWISDSNMLATKVLLDSTLANKVCCVGQQLDQLAHDSCSYPRGYEAHFEESFGPGGSWLVNRLSIRFRIIGMLANKKLGSALELAANCLVQNPENRYLVPMQALYDEFSSPRKTSTYDPIHYSIVMFYCDYYFGKQCGLQVGMALSRLLTMIKKQLPSEITYEEFPDLHHLDWFLYNICIPRYIKFLFKLRSTRELELERIAICNKLRDFPSILVESVESEIKNISIQHFFEDAISEIEYSRIDVDRERMLAWCLSKYTEDYLRYINLSTAPESSTQSTLKAKKQSNTEVMEIASSFSSENALRDLVESLSIEFLTNPLFGLNSYLSLRIRHGIISNHIRKHVESSRVICGISATTGEYKSIGYWDNIFNSLDSKQNELLNKAFMEFSRQIDFQIEFLKNEYIQIRSEDKPHGAFYLQFSEFTIKLLPKLEGLTTDFETMVLSLMMLFEKALEECFQEIRNFIATNISDAIRNAFLLLERAITECGEPARLAPLQNAVIGARNETLNELTKIREWFHWSERGSAEKNYSISSIVEIAKRCVIIMHPNKKLELTVNCDETISAPGVLLSGITDIFTIILENSIKHSGMECSRVTIDINACENNLHIYAKNSVNNNKNANERIQNIERSRLMISDGSYMGVISKEGGTGLPKIQRNINQIAQAYLEASSEIIFGLNQESEFWIEFELPAINMIEYKSRGTAIIERLANEQ